MTNIILTIWQINLLIWLSAGVGSLALATVAVRAR